MYELKTKVNDESVIAFLNNVENEKRKQDSLIMLDVMSDITGEQAKMWGTSIVGFDLYQYTYKSGHNGEYFIVGFSPRKQYLSVYLMDGFESNPDLLSKLGKYKSGKSCLNINKLEDIDMNILKQLITEAYKSMKK